MFTLVTNAFPGATSMSLLCVADVDSDGDPAVFGAPASMWLLAGSLPTAIGVALPPFGMLFLDPASLFVARREWAPPTRHVACWCRRGASN